LKDYQRSQLPQRLREQMPDTQPYPNGAPVLHAVLLGACVAVIAVLALGVWALAMVPAAGLVWLAVRQRPLRPRARDYRRKEWRR
jgi:hypothetical protein